MNALENLSQGGRIFVVGLDPGYARPSILSIRRELDQVSRRSSQASGGSTSLERSNSSCFPGPALYRASIISDATSAKGGSSARAFISLAWDGYVLLEAAAIATLTILIGR